MERILPTCLFIMIPLCLWCGYYYFTVPDNKVHGANMGPIWGRQDPCGPNVGPMNFAIWGV